MDVRLLAADLATVATPLLCLPLHAGEWSTPDKAGPLAQLDAAFGGLLRRTAQAEGFAGKADQTWVFHTHGKIKAERIALLGLGTSTAESLELLRQAAGRAARTAVRLRLGDAVFALPRTDDAPRAMRAVAEGAGLGAYRFGRYRTGAEERSTPALRSVRILIPPGTSLAPLRPALELGRRVAQAANWARDLTNEPAGVMTPARLAEEARSLARSAGLRVSVGGRKEIAKLKMGMFLGVAQGSALEPKLIRVTYTPKNPKDARRRPVCLVGKAITFDSGGLSLKTPEGMIDMKTDMAGSAAVLGAMQVMGHLRPSFPVHAFIGACENMPSGTAYRPGDVLVSRLGKTVEVTNTDAEGRLVLGDMLAYASEEKPALLVDLATLTGACVVALGHYLTGVFGEDEGAVEAVLGAARRAGEPMWRLPIAELQKDALRSDIADMKNSGERWGAAINAAHFLKEFVGTTPWVHLDIAGPSQSPRERGYFIKGATGVGVRTLVELALSHGVRATQ